MIGRYRVLPAADRDPDDQAGDSSTHASRVGCSPSTDPGARTEEERCSESTLRDLKKNLVFYRPVDDGIEVVRDVHAARDLGGVLES